ncbi:MAG TPA: hypothetical protein EYQ00_05455 [Dehalococcoidia bacterium]|jgi:hypothetical protein|nr:hypothetical protein [Dehalococcoidia bacterium]
MKQRDKPAQIGDLVWCQNGVKKEMGIIESIDPSYPKDSSTLVHGEDYCWVVLIESTMGQRKWTQIKRLIPVGEHEIDRYAMPLTEDE